ncbi:LytR C-terminal domain-containing protein [bacterium]|nr:LytR C-terminal domain-containing protein [bacterium]
MTTRINNWALNIGIAFTLVIAAALFYAFFVRVTTATPDPHRLDNPGNLLGDIIQVEVLNGSGEDGLARQMMEYLREMGFDVVSTGNYQDGVLEKTVIKDRIGNLDASEQVALAVGLPTSRISEDINADYFLDATIVVGKDFNSIKPWQADLIDESEEVQADSSKS